MCAAPSFATACANSLPALDGNDRIGLDASQSNVNILEEEEEKHHSEDKVATDIPLPVYKAKALHCDCLDVERLEDRRIDRPPRLAAS